MSAARHRQIEPPSLPDIPPRSDDGPATSLLQELVPTTERAASRSGRPAHGRARLPDPASRGRSGVPPLAIAALAAVVVVSVSVVVAGPWQPARPSGSAAEGVDGAGPARSPTPSAAATAATTPTTPPARAADVKVGIFRGTSRDDVRDFERWSGHDVDYVVDYGLSDTWYQLSRPQYMLDEWKGSGYRTVYGVPMLPRRQQATLEEGAAGAYDRYFRELARRLVASGQEDAILRVGWEFNIRTSRWRTDEEATFIRYWRRIVTQMRSVDGAAFRFDWNPNGGDNAYDGAAYYPGDDVVDYVGVDVYDISWTPGTYPYPPNCSRTCRAERQLAAWDDRMYGERGLAFWSGFARRHRKPMSIPEWGLWARQDAHGGGDNPHFIEQMYAFITDPRNNVAYHAYFEWDAEGSRHRLMETFPEGGKAYRRLFG